MIKRIGIVLISCVFLISCQKGEESNTETVETLTNTETLEFLSYKTPCYTLSQMLCNVEAINGNKQISYTAVDGFNYVWGHSYKLTVNVSKLTNPLSDGSDTKYDLLNILLDTEDSLGTRYEFELVELLETTFLKDEGVLYFLGQPFTCSANVDRDVLLTLN
ncbi:DUF4377 domain-containing protein, partial [Rheinheimera baltica]